MKKNDGASASETALALAEAKAHAVSGRHNDAWVIGADQMLVCEGRWFDKPADKNEALTHLKTLRGRGHDLISAVCVAKNHEIDWRHVESTHLTMLDLSDAFFEDYLAKAGPEVLESVGAYRLEGVGAQLFSKIEGDYFTILGLPLLPLLAYLREAELIAT